MKAFTTTVLIYSTLVLLTAPAHSISCGDTINTDTKLEDDLDCDCTSAPALTVTGPNGRLDLDDHTVSCNDGNNNEPAIAVAGDSARLSNGSVTHGGLGDCVRVKGDNHKISKILANLCLYCILVEGNGNEVQDCDATKARDGIDVRGKKNKVHDNFVKYIGFIGIYVKGKKNKITDNNIKKAGDGIRIRRDSDGTEVIGNKVKYSDWQSLNGDGIVIKSNKCKVTKNKSKDNDCNGITVLGTGNTVSRNRAKDNNKDDSWKYCFDLLDRSDDCSGNTWEDNKYEESAHENESWKYETDPKCIE